MKTSVEAEDIDNILFLSNKDLIRRLEAKFIDDKIDELMTEQLHRELRKRRKGAVLAEDDATDKRRVVDLLVIPLQRSGSTAKHSHDGNEMVNLLSVRSERCPKSHHAQTLEPSPPRESKKSAIRKGSGLNARKLQSADKSTEGTVDTKILNCKKQFESMPIANIYKKYLVEKDYRVPDFLSGLNI